VASIFRKSDAKIWTIKWTDESGARRERSSGTTDRRLADRMGMEIEDRVARIRSGLLDPREEERARHERRPIAEHVGDWARYLAAKDVTADHARKFERELRRVLTIARVERLSDLSSSAVQVALGELVRRGLSLATVNQHITAARSFARWLVQDRRVLADPLPNLSRYNADADPRRERRVLSSDEILRVIDAAERGPVRRSVPGIDRAMLYRIAAGTGLRAAEIESLRRESFDLDAATPTITAAAAATKNGEAVVQPIRRDLADALRPWLATKMPGAPLVPGRRRLSKRTADMLRADLEAAGIPYKTDEGYADFHALRAVLGTELARAGVAHEVTRRLMRHSDIRTTLKHYTKLRLDDLTGALDQLPATAAAPEAEAARATGTTGAPEGPHQIRHHSDAQPGSRALTGAHEVGANARSVNALGSADPAANTRSDSLPLTTEHDGSRRDREGAGGYIVCGSGRHNVVRGKGIGGDGGDRHQIRHHETEGAPATPVAAPSPLLSAARDLVAAHRRLKAALADPGSFLHPAAVRVRDALGPQLDALEAAVDAEGR
jgi:integrase